MPEGRPQFQSSPIEKVLVPFQEFFSSKAASGIVLIFCALAAMIWANSPWQKSYADLWHVSLSLGVGGASISQELHWWINDGLMAIFFFVVGLEIKREILVGELSETRQALLPIMGAVGGMVIPALFYVAFNTSGPGQAGWGIPMATDIAFALGVLAMLGNRIPARLKVLLAAVAIVDDIGAVLVIALFYTAKISIISLVAAGVLLAIALAGNYLGIRQTFFYAIIGLGVWACFLKSGVHSTVAGVAMAMIIPARTRCDSDLFMENVRKVLKTFGKWHRPGATVLDNKEQYSAVLAMQNVTENAQTPLQRMEHALMPWVDYCIMPLFALANAGVAIGGDLGGAIMQPVSIGIIVGLVAGKQVGMFGAIWLLVKSGLSALPEGLTWRHVHGASLLAGIGFTMSLFIASLAFPSGDLLTGAKVGIIIASIMAGVGGWLVLKNAAPENR